MNIEVPANVDINPASVYWIRTRGVYEKFTNEKQFLKIFPEQQSKLKAYIRRESINFKDRDDLVRLIEYCDSQNF